MPASITLVVAYAANYTIGMDNILPWYLPGDMRHFKAITLGRPIIMGRKTWESLNCALPSRRNLVISRAASYLATGAEVFSSLHAALAACRLEDAVCIIGGAQIYALSLPFATHIEATEIDAKIEGDAHFVPPPKGIWREITRCPQSEENGWRYDFVSYERSAAIVEAHNPEK